MLVLPCSRPLFNHYHSLICSCHTMKNKTSKIRLNSCLCLLCFWIQDVCQCSVMASYFAACVYAPHAHQHAVPILLLRFLITFFYWFFSIWIISLNPTLPAPQNKTKKYHNKHTRKKNTRDTRERKKETHLHCIWICMCQVHLVCISTHLYQYDMTHLIHICEGIWSPTQYSVYIIQVHAYVCAQAHLIQNAFLHFPISDSVSWKVFIGLHSET